MTLSVPHLYKHLRNQFGSQDWWPIDKQYHTEQQSDPRFEVIVGAILTQNTAWSNVKKALVLLKKHQVLSVTGIFSLEKETLKTLIQPSGFFNQKAERLKRLVVYLKDNYQGNLDIFFKRNLPDIRQELLSLKGIGPETADSILLYAGNLPVFVVDAYTKRLCGRLPIPITDLSYNHIQQYFEGEIQKSFPKKNLTQVYQQLHALIVEQAKIYCKKKPFCQPCPLHMHCALFQQSL